MHKKMLFNIIRQLSPLKKLLSNVLPPGLLSRVKEMYYVWADQFFWEADVQPIKYLVKPGDCVLDIGAHVGPYTRILSALVGESGRVFSIEPIPETFELLCGVIQKLCLKNVEPINCAISEKDGSAVMEVPLWNHGTANFYQARIIRNERVDKSLLEHRVHVRSIDSLFFGLPKNISFIKCDVEGHELSVIRGASHFLLKSKPAWLIEVAGDPDDDSCPSGEVFNLLAKQSYTAYWLDGERLKKRSPGDKAINYFFLQPSHLSQLAPLILSGKQ